MAYILNFFQSESVLLKGEMLLRIIIAVFCGSFIGYERTNRGKGAGMAIGCGMYFIGIACTIIIFLVQLLMHKNSKFLHNMIESELVINIEESEEAIVKIINLLKEFEINIIEISYKKNKDDLLEVTVLVQYTHNINKGKLIENLYKQESIKLAKV